MTTTLADKFERDRGRVFMSGVQALVRIAIDQRQLDDRAGHKTAGFVSGYRGSPLGGVDQEFVRNAARLAARDIHFTPGVNEELGATAVWGTQKVGLHGKGSTHDGVFGLWYGKAPGVDRAGDVLKQANASGTARHGGVLALCGDDHLAKSSILPAQSEFALQHFEMPVWNPSDLQEVRDYGLHGLAMSRHAGLWSGMICIADTMDASGIVDVDLDRLAVCVPAKDPRAEHDLNRALLLGNRLETERLLRDVRIPAAQAYVRANGLDRVAFGSARGDTLFVATGKAYRDLRQALALVGIDDAGAKRLGIGIYKVAMPWPLDSESLLRAARGKRRLVVVEHKRAFMEPQIKDALYHLAAAERPDVWGKRTPHGEHFLSDVLELTGEEIIAALAVLLPAETAKMTGLSDALMARSAYAAGHAEPGQRTPYFCAGCPHSTSTRTPEGARALPGIGCHAMTELSGRTTDGQIAMGGEGATWVGQALFSRDRHVFANMGDGTYHHSGILAIRQAVAANVPITYKILYNDAVAMTGGQPLDGAMTVAQITAQLAAEGVSRIAVVSDDPGRHEGRLTRNVTLVERDALGEIQEALAAFPGVSAIVYDQTCASEKRRRRKKGALPAASERLYINPRVCEGCGDCSVQSDCIAVEPLATPFGEKRRINQSSCNVDQSCAKGFCPAFSVVAGATPRRERRTLDVATLTKGLNAPAKRVTEPIDILITGVGGAGVTTISGILAMAAHLAGDNASTLDMTGLAQKNGPVTSHVRLAPGAAAIEGPRVPTGGADLVIAADLLVATSADALRLMAPERTVVVADSRVRPTAEFTRRGVLSFDEGRMARTARRAARRLITAEGSATARALLGDEIFGAMLLVGVAYQAGALPLSREVLCEAIRLNGNAVEANLTAFELGRVHAERPDALAAFIAPASPPPMTLEEQIDHFAQELSAYQNAAYAAAFREEIETLAEIDAALGDGTQRVTRRAAESLYKVMAYKDEYEVARLYSAPQFREGLAGELSGGTRTHLLLAPPGLTAADPRTGRPRKRRFGPWIFSALQLLAKGKRLRGTPFDPFGRTAERRRERALIALVKADLALIGDHLGHAPYGTLCDLAAIGSAIRGFGPVKAASDERAMARRDALIAKLTAATPMAAAAQ